MLLTIIVLISSFISAEKNIEVKNAWLRAGAESLNSALYFKIENQSEKPDTLYKVSSDIAKHVQMHETYKKNDMMGMREIKEIVIQPGSSVEFKPGGYHVMLIDLNKDLKEGNKVDFILYFKSADKVHISADVENK